MNSSCDKNSGLLHIDEVGLLRVCQARDVARQADSLCFGPISRASVQNYDMALYYQRIWLQMIKPGTLFPYENQNTHLVVHKLLAYMVNKSAMLCATIRAVSVDPKDSRTVLQ